MLLAWTKAVQLKMLAAKNPKLFSKSLRRIDLHSESAGLSLLKETHARSRPARCFLTQVTTKAIPAALAEAEEHQGRRLHIINQCQRPMVMHTTGGNTDAWFRLLRGTAFWVTVFCSSTLPAQSFPHVKVLQRSSKYVVTLCSILKIPEFEGSKVSSTAVC